ncbi:transporter substrate-binding domain-containing protein [Terrilactibacillus sp. S3-3]|nr:transporter substrate-binding domain-containing protein [Terrilactibacillus sp. S3-3]
MDFACVGDTVPIFQHKEDPKIIYLGAEPPNPNAHGIVVPKPSLIHSVADLKKKKVGYEKLSNKHFLLAQSLEKTHLTLRAIRSVYVSPEQGLEKLKDGSINALVVGEPYLSKALNTGFRKLDVHSLFTSNRDVYVARADVYKKKYRLLL